MTSEIQIVSYTSEAIIKALKRVERMSAYQKQYYTDNSEKIKAYEKAYRKAHPELHRKKYNRAKDDPHFKEKEREKMLESIKDAKND